MHHEPVSDLPSPRGATGPSHGEPRHEVLSLEPMAASVRAARHFVRRLLLEAQRSDWIDAAELAISEIATNALLHAHTAFEIRAELRPEQLRVEVFDTSPQLPLQRTAGAQSTTGRGLDLVAAVTSEHGVQLKPPGKVVWFAIRDDSAAALDEEDLLAQWNVEPDDEKAAAPQPQAVVLLGLPPTLWEAAQDHHSALLRELALYRARHPAEVTDEQVERADAGRSWIATALAAAIDAALARGLTESPIPPGHPSGMRPLPRRLDLRVPVPADGPAAFSAMQDVLNLAEDLAGRDLLLVRPGLPEVRAVRDWACEQAIAQLSGVSASPWLGADQDTFALPATAATSAADTGWDPSEVSESARGCVAADDANRIIAISRPLAAVLGWEVAQLVGRRIVVLMPPHLREAHVAGFTRHLSTGEAHVIGVPLQLPVLRADGTEIACDLLIEEAPSRVGRHIYVAWIEPAAAG